MDVGRNISNVISRSHAALAAAVPLSALWLAQRLLHPLSGKLMSNIKCLGPVRYSLSVRERLNSMVKNMVADISTLGSFNSWLR
jgi:hypothetical protein